MFHRVKKVFELEAVTGILLVIATLISLFLANSHYAEIFKNFFAFELPLNFVIHKNLTVQDWINDALMALFFLLIGLELKEEILVGELSTKSRAILPLIAACGGVIFPALIFYFCNFDQAQNLAGFAIPTATDIAFAYGVICLFGKKIPKSLKVFLISLAIFDDLAAIVIIAIFYSQNLDLIYLGFSSLTIFALWFLNKKNCDKLFIYLLYGIFLWLMILKSGIHPTLAGVVLAIFIPHQNLLKKLIKGIAPTVNFFILPLFAFANSGVKITNFSPEIFTQPLFLGIILGLFFGKQIGVILFSFCAVKSGIANLPRGSNWLQFYSVAILTGIGFTMSFFIGSLAFGTNSALFDEVKIAVLCASFLSTIFGIVVIYFYFQKHDRT
jgi:NhaA family Na+:H+ antiporter